MSTPQGFNDEGNGIYGASLQLNTKPKAGFSGGKELYKFKVDNKTGNIDLYYPTQFGDKIFHRFDATTGKWGIPKDAQNASNTYIDVIKSIGEPGSPEFNKLLSTSKLGANKVILSTSSEEDKRKILEKEGYKSAGNTAGSGGSSGSGGSGGGGADGDTNGSKPPISDEDKEAFNQENVFKENTRLDYGDVKYPLNLSTTHQDCIKFTILEYLPPGLSSKGGGSEQSRIVTLDKGDPRIGGRKPLGTVTLPIPAGINDSNTVNWADDDMGELQEIFGNIASAIIQDGIKSGIDEAKSAGDRVKNDPNSAIQAIVGRFTNEAVGSSSAQQRKFGTIQNPNLELLFTGPNLRDFTFNFRFTPRSAGEAENVKRIIRTFKQSMSAKRSKSSLLLKSPHTFAISYVTSDKQHPYLNKFKECALTGCSVNYTPDGTYMTYDGKVEERSMTAYEMQLTFKELEPLFDDEYGVNDFSNVGF